MLAPLLLLLSAAVAQVVSFEAEALLRRDIHSAAKVLTTSDDPALAAAARAWLELQPARKQVHAVELELLAEGVEEALEWGDVVRAAGLLSAAMLARPDEPILAELLRRVEQATIGATPDAQAEAWPLLAEASRDPEALERYQLRTARADLERRYDPAHRASTRRSQRGITREAALHLIARVDEEYYTEPLWSLATYCGARQLGWLAELGGADAQDRPEAPTDPVQALDAALSWGQQAGLSAETVIDEWVRGALGSLDRWTRAVWPAELESWERGHAGVYYGVGLELERGRLGDVRVARPLPHTSAWTSGIHQGDRVDRIGELVLAELEGDAVARAEEALRGPEGSEVTLEVARRNDPSWEVTLTRGPVVTETVQGLERRDDNAWSLWIDEQAGLAYLRILEFKPTTLGDFDALLYPERERVKGLVIDLRGNPGGDIASAVEIADRFVAEGPLLDISGRVMPESEPEIDPQTGERLPAWNEAARGHAFEGLPTVILVDAETASAAELLAGALQEQADAWVVGALTWGKGRTQALRSEREQGYAVQYSNLLWKLPGGRPLARDLGGGIRPDVRVELSVGEQFQARRLALGRAALRQHADGAPMSWTDPGRRSDLPEMDRDPGLIAGEIVMRVVLRDRASPAPQGEPEAALER